MRKKRTWSSERTELLFRFGSAVVAAAHAAAVTREIADSIRSHERKSTMVAELSRGLSFEHDIRPTWLRHIDDSQYFRGH